MTDIFSQSSLNETVPNILILDKMLAHKIFITECFKKDSRPVNMLEENDLGDLNLFINENSIYCAILFIYNRRDFFKVMHLTEHTMKIVVCAHETDLWWLGEILPNVGLVDLASPKNELYNKINTIVF